MATRLAQEALTRDHRQLDQEHLREASEPPRSSSGVEWRRRAGGRARPEQPPAEPAELDDSPARPAPMVSRRRRRTQTSYRQYVVGMAVLLLATVALAVVLLLTAQPSGPNSQPRTAQPPPPTATTPRPDDTPAPAADAPTPPPTPAPVHASVTVLEPNYTVQSGDTLGAIASRFGTTVEALLAYNRLERSSILHNGQKLIVPQDQ